jgi:hypothetical protein
LVSVVKDHAPPDRATFYVAQLRHPGDRDDAPAALSNLLYLLGEHMQLRVSTERRVLSLGDESLPDYPLVFMHGRRPFRLSAAEREALRRFTENGGLLLANAICANQEFSASFRREMQAIFPGHALERIPPEHPMFTPEFRGHDITTVTLRDPRSRARRDDPLSARLEHVAPHLEGIDIEGRYAVIFVPDDISCALENRPSLECRGYTRQDAAKIGMNVILYAMQQ